MEFQTYGHLRVKGNTIEYTEEIRKDFLEKIVDVLKGVEPISEEDIKFYNGGLLK